MPVPGSMWQPWRLRFGDSGRARAHFFANPFSAVGDRQVAPLICYEQLIVWPALQSMLYDPDLILAVGNGWWTQGTSIVAIQHASAVAMGEPLRKAACSFLQHLTPEEMSCSTLRSSKNAPTLH